MQWKYLGSLSEASNSGASGVYLIVHKGIYNRIVYVGISVNIGRRISEHYEGYCRGNRTIYDVDKYGDVYNLMSSLSINNHIKEYKRLAFNRKIWASTTITSFHPRNLLSEGQSFDDEWKQILYSKYLPSLSVWALPLSSYSYEKASMIESCIQYRIIKNFDLRGFFNLKNISILGKIENNKISHANVRFNILPDVDDVSKIIIDNIYSSKTPRFVDDMVRSQLDTLIAFRENEKKLFLNSRETISLKHPNHGKAWSNVDIEKLRVMVVDFKMTPYEIAEHLGRSPKAIAMKIDFNDKFSQRKWRESITLL